MRSADPEEHRFDVTLDDGRVARCWQGAAQPYKDCVFSAGLVEGIDPDTVYLAFERDDERGLSMFFLRPDEALAVLHVLSGALWSLDMLNMADPDDKSITRILRHPLSKG
jgi:hypothetical protein